MLMFGLSTTNIKEQKKGIVYNIFTSNRIYPYLVHDSNSTNILQYPPTTTIRRNNLVAPGHSPSL